MRSLLCSMPAVALVAALVMVCAPSIADEIRGEIKSIDRAKQTMVVHDEKTNTDIMVSLAAIGTSKGLGKSAGADLKDLKPGSSVIVQASS